MTAISEVNHIPGHYTKTDVSVIIVNFHTSTLVTDCIRSITRVTSGISFEIIIVDNNSEPRLGESIRLKFPAIRIKFISLDNNVGFGIANNAGAQVAEGEFLFFLNPDTILLNDAIGILSDFLSRHPEAGACGGNLYDSDMNPTFSFHRLFPGLLWEINELLHCIPAKLMFRRNRYFNHTGKPLQTAHVSGADFMISRNLFTSVGGFRPDYFMYYEDTDLGRRIAGKGFKIMNVPEAKIQHLESKSFAPGVSFSPQKIMLLEKSRNIYYRLNTSPVVRTLSNIIYRMFLTSRIVCCRNRDKKELYRHRLKSAFTSTEEV